MVPTLSPSLLIVEDEFMIAIPTTSNETGFNHRSYKEMVDFFCNKSAAIKILHNFPTIKKAFLKYNVLLASGQPVENKFFNNVYKEILTSKYEFEIIQAKILNNDIKSLEFN